MRTANKQLSVATAGIFAAELLLAVQQVERFIHAVGGDHYAAHLREHGAETESRRRILADGELDPCFFQCGFGELERDEIVAFEDGDDFEVRIGHGQFSVLSTQYSVLSTQYSVLST